MEIDSKTSAKPHPKEIALRQRLEEMIDLTRKNLVNRPEWGEVNFSAAEKSITMLSRLVEEINSLPLHVIPTAGLDTLQSSLNNVLTWAKKIDSFSISETNNARDSRDSIAAELGNKVNSFFIDSVAWVAYLRTQNEDTAQNRKKLSDAAENVDSLIEGLQVLAKSKVEEIAKIVDAAREAATSVSAAVFTSDFEETSNKRRNASRIWLTATVLFVIATLGACVYFWKNPINESSVGLAMQLISTKLVVIGVLVTATIWSGRIYKALMHQSEVYHHRAISIKTLRAFAASASDPVMRDSIVVEAAKSVFGHVSTGFIDSNQSSGDGSLKLLEVARGLLPGNEKP